MKGVKEKEVKEEEAAGGGRCSCSRVMGWEGPPPSPPPTASLVIKTFAEKKYSHIEDHIFWVGVDIIPPTINH